MALSPEEEEILSRYRKMLRMGMPEGAVMQKMAVDDVPQNIQDALSDEVTTPREDRGADPPETAVNHSTSTEPRTVQHLDSFKPDSVSSFFEEVVEEDDRVEFDEEEIVEEEVVFDDDGDGDEVRHQLYPTGYDISGHPRSINSQYTEESYYGSTEGEPIDDRVIKSTPATAATDVENQEQQSQHQRDSVRSVTFTPPEQAPTSVAPTIEKPLPAPSSIWYWVTCFLLLVQFAIAGGVAYWLTENEDGIAPRVQPNVTEAPTLTPVRVSSEFNSVQGNCDFSGVDYPNPTDQCDCEGFIRDIPADVQRRYEYNRESFISTLYADYDDDISSCSARNQALVWVSSGDDENISQEERVERYALATFFAALSGPQWNNRDGWLSYGEGSPCNWAGVSCSNSTGVVLRLSIPRNNAEGVIPGEISLLTFLQTFVASDNDISGPLPVAMFLIPALEDVDVSVNALTGVIPQTVSQTTLLRTLNMARNSMNGRVTPNIGKATNLELLNLNSNEYQGTLPLEIFQLSKLRELNIGGNQLTGSVSSSISRLSMLESLTLGPNLFVGTIQSSIGELSNLKFLSIQGIGFNGRLPASFGLQLTNLETLLITDTQIEGNIDTSFGNLPQLTTFYLSSNQLRSVIPSEFGNLSRLVALHLDNNFMNGQIPVTFGNIPELQELWLNDNLLSGGIPGSLGNLSSLRSLRLEANRLRDRVVNQICALREEELSEFVVDCPLDVDGESVGVVCAIPECCTSCESLI